MTERVLVSTFGFDPEKVLRSLRWIGYDRLVLLAGSDSLREPGLERIQAAERAAGAGVEVVSVDPFDFRASFEGAVATFRKHRRAGHEVRVNVSGGTKILSDAALLAAFQEGVEAWHCEDRPVRLPVLSGVSFADALSRADRAVLAHVDRARLASRVVDRLASDGHTPTSIRASIARLRDQGLITVTIRHGEAVVSPDPSVSWFVRGLR